MLSLLPLAGAGMADWGQFVALVLISMGAVGYTLLLDRRVWILARMGWAGIRTHFASVVGLLGGVTAIGVLGFYICVAWLEGWKAANAIWTVHRWQGMLVIICGFAFT